MNVIRLGMFGECDSTWYEGVKDHYYWCVYGTALPLSRESRNKLKSLGWKLRRHERTNKEYWIICPHCDSYYSKNGQNSISRKK